MIHLFAASVSIRAPAFVFPLDVSARLAAIYSQARLVLEKGGKDSSVT